MVWKLLGSGWSKHAQGWLITHLADNYYLYPSGEIHRVLPDGFYGCKKVSD